MLYFNAGLNPAEKGPKVSMKPIPTRPGLQGPTHSKSAWSAGNVYIWSMVCINKF